MNNDNRTPNPILFHLMGFVMHQPAGNLLEMFHRSAAAAYEARQILLAYERPLRYAELYRSEARFCVCFSGVLLEQLRQPALARECSSFLDIPSMLDRYASAENIELAGTGYFHPLFPLTPEQDWGRQIELGRDIVVDTFGRSPTIFWAPEMGFNCSMIPHLVQHGYKQVVCDGIHLRPHVDGHSSDVDPIYSLHIAESGDDEIVIVPRDGFLSGAQQGGTNFPWFEEQAQDRTCNSAQHALITTWTDGENGGWFRVEDEDQQFWGHFFRPYMHAVRAGSTRLAPVSLTEFLRAHPPKLKATVQSGTWQYDPNRPDAHFWQWAHSGAQRAIFEDIRNTSVRLNTLEARAALKSHDRADAMLCGKLEAARALLLLSEASDNFYYGDDWLYKSRQAVTGANLVLNDVERLLAGQSGSR